MIDTGNVKAPKKMEPKAAEPQQNEVQEAPAGTQVPKNLDTLRDKLEFVAPIGDPSSIDITKVQKKVPGTNKVEEKEIRKPKIVGYMFKALEAMKIPDCGTTARFKTNRMDFEKPWNWKDVPAGTEFQTTPYEMGLLLSQPEFNGQCTGGKYTAICTYRRRKNLKDVEAATGVSAFDTSLRCDGTSLKNMKYIDCLTFEEVTGPGGTKRKIRHIKPGFEKFAPLAEATVRRAKASGGAKGPVVNTMAQEFLKLAQAKGSQK